MGAKPDNKCGTVVNLDERRISDHRPVADDLRRSTVYTVAPATSAPSNEPSVADLRDRYVILLTAREYAPERLSTRALYAFDCHQKVAMEYGYEDGEDVYSNTAAGALMRQRLREILPDWWEY